MSAAATRAASIDEINAELAAVAEEIRQQWIEIIEPHPAVVDGLEAGPVKDMMQRLAGQMATVDAVLARQVDFAYLWQQGASLEEIAERLGWKEFEFTHARDSLGAVYEGEVVISAHSGRELRCAFSPSGVDYVRVVEHGFELAYWVCDEWREAPEEVMGAILGCLLNDAAPREHADTNVARLRDRGG